MELDDAIESFEKETLEIIQLENSVGGTSMQIDDYLDRDINGTKAQNRILSSSIEKEVIHNKNTQNK